MGNYVNEYLAVLVEEDEGSETIVVGACIDDTEDTLVLAYYLKKGEAGVGSREVTINKDYIIEVAVLNRKKETKNEDTRQLALTFEGEGQSEAAA